jgi:hypothetical protein
MRKSVFEALVATVTGMESTFKANPIQFAPKVLECTDQGGQVSRLMMTSRASFAPRRR